MKLAAQAAALLTFEAEPYYFDMKELARQVREHYALVSPRVRCSELRKIYRAQGIRLTLWPGKVRNVRGAYFSDELGVNVMVMRELPEDAMAFTMAHELKHHLVDSDLKPYSKWRFDQLNPIEVGAYHPSAKEENRDYVAVPSLSGTGGIDGICSGEHVPHEFLAEVGEGELVGC